jgi:hypothetical protein
MLRVCRSTRKILGEREGRLKAEGERDAGIENLTCNRNKPKVVIIENIVKAPWDLMQAFLESLGYNAAYVQIDTKKYYVPQTRNRRYCFSLSSLPFSLLFSTCLFFFLTCPLSLKISWVVSRFLMNFLHLIGILWRLSRRDLI